MRGEKWKNYQRAPCPKTKNMWFYWLLTIAGMEKWARKMLTCTGGVRTHTSRVRSASHKIHNVRSGDERPQQSNWWASLLRVHCGLVGCALASWSSVVSSSPDGAKPWFIARKLSTSAVFHIGRKRIWCLAKTYERRKMEKLSTSTLSENQKYVFMFYNLIN